MARNDVINFDGRNFYRYDGNRYYWTKHFPVRGRSTSLHVYVWEKHFGPRPAGYEVHHKVDNFATTRLEDLELLTEHGHASLHAKDRHAKGTLRPPGDKAHEAAAAWHGSREGRAWHKARGKANWAKRRKIRFSCSECGKSYWAYFQRRGFCSPACQQRVRRREHPGEERRYRG